VLKYLLVTDAQQFEVISGDKREYAKLGYLAKIKGKGVSDARSGV